MRGSSRGSSSKHRGRIHNRIIRSRSRTREQWVLGSRWVGSRV